MKKFGPKRVRLGFVWVLAPLYLIFARPTPPLLAAGAGVALVGVLIRSWAAGIIRKNARLATTGPYAFTRNPLYLGSFIIGLGLAVAGGRVSILVVYLVLFALIYGWAMRSEADRMEQLFGDEYRTYAAHVPLFFPRLRPYRPGGAVDGSRFQLERYLTNREYEAALGIVLGFLALLAKFMWF